MNPHRHIFRVEQRSENSSAAWVVTVQSQGKKHSKTFTDGKLGSSEKALAEAIKFRDHLIEKLGVATRVGKSANLYPGVSRTESERTIDGYLSRSAYWQAYWMAKHVHGKSLGDLLSVLAHPVCLPIRRAREIAVNGPL